jgi:hypothetical protein
LREFDCEAGWPSDSEEHHGFKMREIGRDGKHNRMSGPYGINDGASSGRILISEAG